MRKSKIRQLLFLSSALGAGLSGGLGGLYSSARASCTSYAPTSGTTVTCSGTSTTAVNAATGSTDVAVHFEDGAQHTVTGAAVTIRDSSDIVLDGTASVAGSSGALRIIGSGTVDTYSTITLNDSSSVVSSGTASGIVVTGSHNQIALNDQSSVVNTSTGTGILITGGVIAGNNAVVVGQSASVAGSSAAIQFIAGSNTLTNFGTLSSNGITFNGGAADTVFNYGNISSTAGTAINLNSSDDRLTLGTGSNISGSIDGGAGTDDLTLVGSGSEDDNVSNFETLTMSGSYWTLAGTSSFTTVALNSGILTNAGSLTATGGVAFSTAGDAVLINSGSLVANISGGSGTDIIINRGTIDGLITLDGGQDAIVLDTGSSVAGNIDGGDGTDDLTLIGSGSEDSDFTNFETLAVNGSDWTLSGTSSLTTIGLNSGTLTNNGSLTATSGLTFAASGASFVNNATFTGSISGSIGSDLVENSGAIEGSIALDGGDDSLVLGTGSSISGTIDGGDGTDDLTLVGSGSEDSDISNFETLTVNGSDWTLSGASSFATIVLNSGYFYNFGSLTATSGLNFGAGGAGLINHSTVIANITGSSGNDTIYNYGTIDGSIALGGGDDYLSLGMGSIITGSIDGGDGTDDLTLLASGSAENNITNFEILRMDGVDWTLSGASSVGSIRLVNGTLTNEGAITAITVGFDSDGGAALRNNGSLTATITGGTGDDTLENHGAIIGLIALSDGDDHLTLGTGSSISGTIDGGVDADDLTLIGTGSEDSDFSGFETLAMNGSDWMLSGTSSFASILVNTGTLRLNGATTGDVAVTNSATLGGSGTITGDVTSFGTLAAGNSVGTMTIIGNLVQDGGSFDVEFDQTGVDLWDVSGTATLLNTPTLSITALNGASSVSGVILHADGGIIGSFADPPIYSGNGSASVQQTANDVILNVISGTPVAADHHASLQTGLGFFTQLGQEAFSSCNDNGQWQLSTPRGCRGRLWTKGFGELGREDAHDGNEAFDYDIGGVATGIDADLGARNFGASLGYSASSVEVAGDASSTTIGSIMGALYATFRQAGGFVTATIGGGSQDLDMLRTSIVGTETLEVETETKGKVLGGSLRAGATLESGKEWIFTPSARLTYLHQWIAAYEEDMGTASITIDDHDSGLLQLAGEIEARHSRMIDETLVSPHLTLGIIGDVARGGTATGAFSTGDAFSLSLYEAQELRALVGLGAEAEFANGSTVRLSYKGEASQDGFAHSLTGEVRVLW